MANKRRGLTLHPHMYTFPQNQTGRSMNLNSAI